jgi:hypothetical protein
VNLGSSPLKYTFVGEFVIVINMQIDEFIIINIKTTILGEIKNRGIEPLFSLYIARWML